MSTDPARRNLLAAALSAVAAGALSGATAAPVALAPADPIFRALAAWEAADLDVMRVYAETAGDDSPEANALCDAQDARRDGLSKALADTMPATIPGLLALARHYAETASDPDSDGLTHIVQALKEFTL